MPLGIAKPSTLFVILLIVEEKNAASKISLKAMSCKLVTVLFLTADGEAPFGRLPWACASIAKICSGFGLGKPLPRGLLANEKGDADVRTDRHARPTREAEAVEACILEVGVINIGGNVNGKLTAGDFLKAFIQSHHTFLSTDHCRAWTSKRHIFLEKLE